MIRFLTSGESHGPRLTAIIEGLPAGLTLEAAEVDAQLKRRQGGFGRGGRMKIESDRVEITSGVRWGETLGSPLTLVIENRDWKNWTEGMGVEADKKGSLAPVTRPRPGHADLAGLQKYDRSDVRDILERSSARETAARVAVGAVCSRLLREFGILVGGYVVNIGGALASLPPMHAREFHALSEAAEGSEVRCPDAEASSKMKALIEKAMSEGDTLGGVVECYATGVPVGLGSHVHWDRRLDGQLAQALMSIQAIKAVEVGAGILAGSTPGSALMDEILPGLMRATNNAGGIEGGMTNGMPVVARATMKPIPTLRRPLRSVDLATGQAVEAAYERSDVCAVPACSVVAEAMMAIVLAGAMAEKFGADSVAEMRRNYESYLGSLKR